MSGDAKAAKKQRLVEALRANLRRRKAADARSRHESVAAGATEPTPDPPPGNEDKG